MMRLPKPPVDIPAYIGQIVQERQAGVNAGFFQGILQDWIGRCQEYDLYGGDGTLIAPWPTATGQSASFKNLYKAPAENSIQQPIITRLRDRTLQLCPMCGEAGIPNTLDHYLSQDEYPDFSILPMNLVPACDTCQLHKLARAVGPAGRLFLHPYYDVCLDQQVVSLRIHPPFHAPTPELRCHPDVPGAMQPLVERHLAELQVHPRFKKFFRKDYIRLLRLVQRARIRGKDVGESLSDMREHAADRSLNSWEHFLYEAATADPDLLDYLTVGQLPAFL